eukprot:508238-Ditylum_brightwellii.AAC.1
MNVLWDHFDGTIVRSFISLYSFVNNLIPITKYAFQLWQDCVEAQNTKKILEDVGVEYKDKLCCFGKIQLVFAPFGQDNPLITHDVAIVIDANVSHCCPNPQIL